MALIVNAFAKADICDVALFRRMAAVAVTLPIGKSDSQNVAVILNAYAKVDLFEAEPLVATLVEKLAGDIPRLDASSTNPQAIGNIVNAYARFLQSTTAADSATEPEAAATVPRLAPEGELELQGMQLIAHMAALALALPAAEYDAQSVTLVSNAFSRAGLSDLELFQYLSRVARQLPPGEYEAQGAANMLNSLAKACSLDEELLSHMALAARAMPRESFTTQSLVLMVSALARAERCNAALLHLIIDLALDIEQPVWTGQSISNLLNAVARLHELSFASDDDVRLPPPLPAASGRRARARDVAAAAAAQVERLFAHMSGVMQATEVYMWEGVRPWPGPRAALARAWEGGA